MSEEYIANLVNGKPLTDEDKPVLSLSPNTINLLLPLNKKQIIAQSKEPDLRAYNANLNDKDYDLAVKNMLDIADVLTATEWAGYVEVHLLRLPVGTLGNRLSDGIMDDFEKVIAKDYKVCNYLRERWLEMLGDGYDNEEEFDEVATAMLKDLAKFVAQEGNRFGGNWGNIYLDGNDLKLNVRHDRQKHTLLGFEKSTAVAEMELSWDD